MAQSIFYHDDVSNEELDTHDNDNYIYSWSSFSKWEGVPSSIVSFTSSGIEWLTDSPVLFCWKDKLESEISLGGFSCSMFEK